MFINEDTLKIFVFSFSSAENFENKLDKLKEKFHID